jgi:hypothetical protein
MAMMLESRKKAKGCSGHLDYIKFLFFSLPEKIPGHR